MVRRLKITVGDLGVTARLAMPADGGEVGVVLAHGAGAGQDHPFMVGIRDRLAAAGLPTMTFNYAYTEQARKGPDRLPKLLAVHAAAVERMKPYVDEIVLAGKSMGGRVGAHLVGDEGVTAAALVYYGYPLVPLGKGEPRATDHLARIGVPQLFFAGTRDRLSPPELIGPLAERLPAASVVVVDDGDHSFNMPKRSGLSHDDILDMLAGETARWVAGTPSQR